MSENRMRQYVWEGVCMLDNNRYQHISIGIHTQTGGGNCLHIVIGVKTGAIDVSCMTGQTGYDVKRTQRGPLNHHWDHTLSSPWCSDLIDTREHPRGSPQCGPRYQPDHTSNLTGLILLQPGHARSSISISYISEAAQHKENFSDKNTQE